MAADIGHLQTPKNLSTISTPCAVSKATANSLVLVPDHQLLYNGFDVSASRTSGLGMHRFQSCDVRVQLSNRRWRSPLHNTTSELVAEKFWFQVLGFARSAGSSPFAEIEVHGS